MPTLETTAGKPVEVTPPDAEQVNRTFDAAMNDDGPDDKAPPKRKPAERAARPRAGKAEKSRTTSKAPSGMTYEQRLEGARGLHQIGAAIAAIAGKVTGSDAFLADSLVISSAADDGAKILTDTAEADPGFAAILDKVCAAGPYGALIAYGVSLGTQIARNHRPSLALPGTVDPKQLLEAARTEAAAAA